MTETFGTSKHVWCAKLPEGKKMNHVKVCEFRFCAPIGVFATPRNHPQQPDSEISSWSISSFVTIDQNNFVQKNK